MSAALARESLELVESAGSILIAALFLVSFSAARYIALCIRGLGNSSIILGFRRRVTVL
jgi:hypothetical protein